MIHKGKSGYKLFFPFFILFPLMISAQAVCPEARVELDKMLLFIKCKMNEKINPDSKILDSMNLVIKTKQQVCDSNKKQFNHSADSIKGKISRRITKQGFGAASIKVPENVNWKIERVFCSYNGSYNVLVNSIKCPIMYKSGEYINIPTWTAESELLTNDPTTVLYTYEIEELH